MSQNKQEQSVINQQQAQPEQAQPVSNQQEPPVQAPPASWYQRAKSSAMGATSAAGSAISGTASSAYNAVGNISQKASHSVKDAAYNATHDFTDDTYGTIAINKDITNVIVAENKIKRQCLLYIDVNTARQIIEALRGHINSADTNLAEKFAPRQGHMLSKKERHAIIDADDLERQQKLTSSIQFDPNGTNPLRCNVSDSKVTTPKGVVNTIVPGFITSINPNLKRLTFVSSGKLDKTGNQIQSTLAPSHCSFENLCISHEGLTNSTKGLTNSTEGQKGGHYDDLSNSVSFNDFIGGKLSATSDDNICE
jgi:hypothetical protein